jgi:hypothetical protein
MITPPFFIFPGNFTHSSAMRSRWMYSLEPVLEIRIRRIRMFLDLQDPDPEVRNRIRLLIWLRILLFYEIMPAKQDFLTQNLAKN